MFGLKDRLSRPHPHSGPCFQIGSFEILLRCTIVPSGCWAFKFDDKIRSADWMAQE
jgi:hypothetical protein